MIGELVQAQREASIVIGDQTFRALSQRADKRTEGHLRLHNDMNEGGPRLGEAKGLVQHGRV